MQILRPYGDIENIFDDILVPVPVEATYDLPADVYEGRGRITVEVEMPGIKPGDVHVEVDGESLIVSGKREAVRERETHEFWSKEIHRGEFSRTIWLPSKVDAQGAEAWYDNGVLRIALPKQA